MPISPVPLRIVFLPFGWEHRVASAANLLDPLGSHLLFWVLGGVLLVAALVLARRRPAMAILLAACASFCLGVSANGLVDDSYIQFRYAANLAAGHGPVFTPGERIEGASGGAWIGILGGLGALTGWDVASLGRFLSLLLTPLATAAAGLAGAALGGPVAGALAAILWASVPTGSMYSATGLETSGFVLALFLFAAAARTRPTLASFAGAGIATLRPEGLVLGLAALPLLSRMPRAARRGVLVLLGAAGLIAAARLAYYGLPFPRSALVKGVTAAAGPADGLAYLGAAVFEWLPLAGGFAILARNRSRLLPALVPVTLWTAMVVARGGDWMPGSRYLLPLVALLVLALACDPLRARWLAAAAVLLALLQMAPAEKPSPSIVGRRFRQMNLLLAQARWWESFGTWLGQSVPPGTRLACGPSGAVSYASRLPVYDMYGLCSKVTRTREGMAGHRLWGLADAAAMRIPIVYPGVQHVPQEGSWDTTAAAALSTVGIVPGFEREYRLLAFAHTAEYHSDYLRDVIWFRRDVPLPGAAAPAPPAGH